MAKKLTVIDSLEHYSTSITSDNNVVQLDATHFMSIIRGVAASGVATTFEVDGSYNITKIHEFTFDATAVETHAVKIDDTHVAVAYRGSGIDVYVKILEVDGAYTISTVSTLIYGGTFYRPKLLLLDSSHMVLAYHNTTSANVHIVGISGAYALSNLSSSTITVCLGTYTLSYVDATHFLFGYAGSAGAVTRNYYLRSMAMNATTHAVTTIDTELVFPYDGVSDYYCALYRVDSSTHVVAVYASAGVGVRYSIRTVGVDGSYLITPFNITTLSPNTRPMKFVQVDGYLFAMASSSTFWLLTVNPDNYNEVNIIYRLPLGYDEFTSIDLLTDGYLCVSYQNMSTKYGMVAVLGVTEAFAPRSTGFF